MTKIKVKTFPTAVNRDISTWTQHLMDRKLHHKHKNKDSSTLKTSQQMFNPNYNKFKTALKHVMDSVLNSRQNVFLF